MEDHCDLVVVGGGPAGTTLATLVKKYAPRRRVRLLEMAPAARHHIGESLLPGIVPVLKEMGVFEKIDAAGFPRKIGANYIWGESRTPWENDFNDVNMTEMLSRYGRIPDKIEYAWQVRRSQYDEILLCHARDSGVEVVRGAAAQGLLEDAGRARGVVWRDGAGAVRRTTADTVADCSGQNGFISRHRKVRDYNENLRNVAGYAYFRGAKWKYEYSGHPDKTKIFICSVPGGWFWYIPISRDIVSIGLVTPADRIRAEGRSLREIFFKELAACADLRPLLERATLIEDFDGTGQDFFTQSDWSYLSARAAGPGWLACGDAAMFVDPILSTGVTLAHLGAHRAAYTLLTDWAQDDGAGRQDLWDDYNAYMRDSAALFLVLALFWYGNDRRTQSWWGKARELQRAHLPIALDDHQAFVAVSAGLTRHYERLLSAAEIVEEQDARAEEFPFHGAVLGGAQVGDEFPSPGAVPRILLPRKVAVAYHPRQNEGRLIPVKRVIFHKFSGDDPLNNALNPKRFVTRYHLALLDQIDGRLTFQQICAAAADAGVPHWWITGRAPSFMRELRLQGAVDWAEAAEGRAVNKTLAPQESPC